MAVARNAASCPVVAKDQELNRVHKERARREFSALFACIEAGQQPDAICISKMNGPSRNR
jgi:hypothetical protein